jgi:hypothetical protein
MITCPCGMLTGLRCLMGGCLLGLCVFFSVVCEYCVEKLVSGEHWVVVLV